ncbi:hypothetical protein [Corallococcus caeni]
MQRPCHTPLPSEDLAEWASPRAFDASTDTSELGITQGVQATAQKNIEA